MDNFQGMVIGIDDYRYLQPLNGCEANAQALYQYFNETEISHDKLILLTDNSSQVGQYPTYPNQENIERCLENWSSQVKLGWFFFQGYGASYQGKDYVIPIDGNPENLQNTAIDMGWLFDQLQLKTQQLLIILNLTLTKEDPGLQKRAIALAQQKGISLVIDCQSIHVKTQLLTTALLEALHYYGYHLTLTHLATYFQERLTPVPRISTPPSSTSIVIESSRVTRDLPLLPQPTINPTQFKVVSSSVKGSLRGLPTVTLPILPKPSPSLMSFPVSSSPQKTLNWRYRKWFFLGGLIFFLLGFLSFRYFNFYGILSKQSDSRTEFSPETIQENRQILNYAKTFVSANQASRLNQGIEVARQIKPNTPLYQEAQESITRWSLGILEIAQGRANQGNFQEAIAAAQLVPPDRHHLYDIAQQSITRWQKRY